jgi:hypothetical protein
MRLLGDLYGKKFGLENSLSQSEGGVRDICGTVAYPGILFAGGGVQQIQLRTEGRENGDLGAVAP